MVSDTSPPYLLVGTAAAAPGRSRLTFLLRDVGYRVCTVWGDPPSDQAVADAGLLLWREQQARPVPPPPAAPGPGLEPGE